MLIGIMSDAHDNIYLVDKAIEKFNELKVSLVLYAGDFVSPFVPPRFAKLRCKMVAVYGNNENEKELIMRRLKDIGHEVRGYFAYIELNGRSIAMTHGHEKDLLSYLINKADVDVVIYGHTHKAHVEKRGRKLIVNPGECCGYLTGKSTIAVLDLERLEARLIEL
ncbi:MAG: hypothetical protein DRN15_03345 [Thermoprotei archaeon]|nr:MAG: hypothetical protein DRN15_03345 [Thermoprotei archaeon]